MTLSDAQAVNLTIAGNRNQFRVLVDKYQKPLYDLALRMTGNPQDAADITQTAFLKMYNALSRYDGRHPFLNWAYSITLNTARNHLRHKTVVKFLSLDFRLGGAEENDGPCVDVHDRRQDAEDMFAAGELLKKLERGLLRLPQDLRAAFILFHLHNNTVKDVAFQCGVSENAINIRLSRARTLLYKSIDIKEARK
ncbi:MAG: RNA polymerase sigma factor [Elusimicrobiales bacterium]|nr:RNA polymerase sigma factor [Elusimicrobiales bacterium]